LLCLSGVSSTKLIFVGEIGGGFSGRVWSVQLSPWFDWLFSFQKTETN
jgi:hypothetical protein